MNFVEKVVPEQRSEPCRAVRVIAVFIIVNDSSATLTNRVHRCLLLPLAFDLTAEPGGSQRAENRKDQQRAEAELEPAAFTLWRVAHARIIILHQAAEQVPRRQVSSRLAPRLGETRRRVTEARMANRNADPMSETSGQSRQ